MLGQVWMVEVWSVSLSMWWLQTAIHPPGSQARERGGGGCSSRGG